MHDIHRSRSRDFAFLNSSFVTVDDIKELWERVIRALYIRQLHCDRWDKESYFNKHESAMIIYQIQHYRERSRRAEI